MNAAELLILIILFLVTSAIGVVTGSNSLVTVPVMFQFGIEPKTAVATNMFGLLFLSIGGSLPFLGKGVVDQKRLPKLIFLTLIGSAIGAILVGVITGYALKIIVSVSMIAVSIFILIKRDAGLKKGDYISTKSLFVAYLITFLMAIYGGLFSGGYVTILTASYIAFFGMTYTEAIAETKIINIFSSAIATAVFMWQGLIDYKLGIILAVVMFAGAYIGAKTVTKLNDLWLRRIFFSAVLILAVKTILDFTI